MALNIKNAEVERLAAALAKATNRTKTETIRIALEHEYARQGIHPERKNMGHLQEYLEKNVWPITAPDGFAEPMTKQEVEEILGFGKDGH